MESRTDSKNPRAHNIFKLFLIDTCLDKKVISVKANSMKNNSTTEEQIQFALEILRRNKDNDIVQSFLKKEVASN